MTNKSKVKLKTYIQPFEKLLAYEEFMAITNKNYSPIFQNIPDEFLEFDPTYTDKIQKKAAYWEKIVHSLGDEIPTNQVLFEKSKDDLINLLNFEDYPKRRYLRYGVHDLHEYRGKFFPQLVRSLINISGIKEKSNILEPFSGSGTTACEANMLNMNCTGIDLNPLSVLISQNKTDLLKIDSNKLYTSSQLIIEAIRNIVPNYETTEHLKRWSERDLKYISEWFSPNALVDIANLLDVIETEKIPTFVDFYKICLSNIIRTISYQKESDLRVRKEIYDYENMAVISLFIKQLSYQLEKIIPFINVKDTLNVKLGESTIYNSSINEIEISNKIDTKFDLLITSPPYATALPYLDTDRLSLIVLGLLPRSEHKNTDLKMIGNREVTEKQRKELWDYYESRKNELPQSVIKVVENIANINHKEGVGFRRRNLPALLGKYFLDMLDSMKKSFEMMKNNTYAFYVVGNNSTNLDNVKTIIPTDELLFDIGEIIGWKKYSFVNMELLTSRDIFQVNSGNAESILVFKKEDKKIRINSGEIERKAIYTSKTSSSIETDNSWDFEDAESSKGLHALHPYPAKFIADIPRKAILEWTKPNDTILDPFCGSGTTLLEAIKHKRYAIGVDNNSVACLVSEAKTQNYTSGDITRFEKFLREIESLSVEELQIKEKIIPQYKNLDYWFSEEAIDELGVLNYQISKETEKVKKLLTAIFSSIIVNVSYQDSDTRYSRKFYEYELGKAIKSFKVKLKRIIESLRGELDVYETEALVYHADGKDMYFVEDNSVDLIITSPPYLNAYDYHKYHRHRIHWIDGDVLLARDFEIGKHDTFTRPNATPEKYFVDMNECFKEWYRVLKIESKLCIVIGDAVVNKKPVVVGDTFVDMLLEIGFKLEKRWIRNIKTTNKSFNQGARMDKEHVLLFYK